MYSVEGAIHRCSGGGGEGQTRQKIKHIGSGEPSAIGLDSLCLCINVCVSVLYIYILKSGLPFFHCTDMCDINDFAVQ